MQVNIREYSVNFSEFLAGLRPAAYARHYCRANQRTNNKPNKPNKAAISVQSPRLGEAFARKQGRGGTEIVLLV